MEEEAIYILTNPCMDGLVKIGRTLSSRIKQRLKELSSPTSIPVAFECYYAAEVKNAKFVEERLHEAFGDHRVSPKREFFKVSPHRIKAALELVAIKEITPDNDPEEAEELKNYFDRRPPFRFSLAKIPVGAELQFVKNEQTICKVIDDKAIEFQGQLTSLSAAASELLRNLGRKSDQVQGPIYWMYGGEILE